MTRAKDAKMTRDDGAATAALPTFSYNHDWTPEYGATAEFDLVVQEQKLPVHKHVMSMSPVFQRELFKTESKRALLNSKKKSPVHERMQLSSPLFMDVSVEDICLLLCHVYATEATLSTERMADVRRLFGLTEEFEFRSITRRCVNFVRNVENLAAGIRIDLEKTDAVAASEWLELAVKWDFDEIKDEVCTYIGENFLDIFGSEKGAEPNGKWADLLMLLESERDLWKRVARSQALRIEAGPSLASLFSDEPSTTLIYGVLIGIFAGAILPSWMFFLIVIGTCWYVYSKMPPALAVVLQKTVEGAMSGIFHGKETPVDQGSSDVGGIERTSSLKNKGKPPVLRRTPAITT